MSRSTSRELFFDPTVRAAQTLFQGDDRLPAQNSTEPCVVARTAFDTLRRRGQMALRDAVSRYRGDDRDQVVDRDHALLADVEWVPVVRLHQPANAFDAIIDIAV